MVTLKELQAFLGKSGHCVHDNFTIANLPRRDLSFAQVQLEDSDAKWEKILRAR